MQSLVKLVTDSYSFEIPETALSMDNGVELATEMRPITQIEGLQWCIEYSPAGYDKEDAGFISVFLNVTKAVGIRYVFAVKNTAVQLHEQFFADEPMSFGAHHLISHDNLRKSGAMQNGKFVITCNAEFEVPLAKVEDPLPIQDLLLESCPQVTFVVGNDTVKMNKAILTNISPVFNAMFNHDTKEAKTGTVQIEDFNLKTIQKVKNFCLGSELDNFTFQEGIEVLKFADKYDIQGLQEYLEIFLSINITVDNFCDLVSYAWAYSRDGLKEKCAHYFSEHGDGVYLTAAFVELEPTVMASLVKAAFAYKSR
uniref:BTB domain-containing protein n=1 Tax=Panagrellus redivivus TaxID=6233 RepID=A0A7E4ZXJ9_PANRE